MNDLHQGPFDVVPWPDTLTARVVTPGARPHTRPGSARVMIFDPAN